MAQLPQGITFHKCFCLAEIKESTNYDIEWPLNDLFREQDNNKPT